MLSRGNQIEVFDTKNWQSRVTFEGKNDAVNCLAGSPDGKLLAAGFGQPRRSPGLVRIWDVAAAKLVSELK